MPVRYLSDPELARLSSWPDEIAAQDAVTYFTLSTDDLSWLTGFNRQHNRLGVAVQLSTLPWLGWIPDDLAGCPPIALDRLAQALGVAPATASALLAEYGGWQGTTSTSTAPTPSTSPPNTGATATALYASPHNPREITKTTKFVPLLSRPPEGEQLSWLWRFAGS
jgi:hypothetical protein